MLERDYESALCARIRKDLGVDSIKMNILNNRGYPDRLFLMPFRPCWVEFKTNGKRPSKLQLYRLAQLNELGYDAKWSDDYAATYDWLTEIYAARLSEARNKEDDCPSVRRAIFGSRTGQDFYNTGDVKALKK